MVNLPVVWSACTIPRSTSIMPTLYGPGSPYLPSPGLRHVVPLVFHGMGVSMPVAGLPAVGGTATPAPAGAVGIVPARPAEAMGVGLVGPFMPELARPALAELPGLASVPAVLVGFAVPECPPLVAADVALPPATDTERVP